MNIPQDETSFYNDPQSFDELNGALQSEAVVDRQNENAIQLNLNSIATSSLQIPRSDIIWESIKNFKN